MTTMREMLKALEYTPEEQSAADELVPGWRDMTVVEFNKRARAAAAEQWRIYAKAQGLA